MSNISISKKYFKYLQFIFILLLLFNFIKSQDYTEESMKADLVPGTGLGKGTFAVIIFVAVGVVICILGLAFPFPPLFIFIGFALPIIVLLFVAFCPKEDLNKEIQDNMNPKKNLYIVARWFHFLIMLILFLGLLGPAFMKWSITIIPQRVDSSSNKDLYDEKYLESIEIQKKRKYNLEENDLLLPNNKLPMSLNRNRRNNFVRRNQNTSDNALIQSSSNNISNNLIDNSNAENSNDMNRNVLPRKTENKFANDRKKFRPFKRTFNNR